MQQSKLLTRGMPDAGQAAPSHHIVGALTTKNAQALTNAQECIEHIDSLLQKLDVEVIGQLSHSFGSVAEQSGFTACIGLSESHIAIHTWPEHGAVELDVYLCNYLQDNRQKCRDIFDQICDYFAPQKVYADTVKRPAYSL